MSNDDLLITLETDSDHAVEDINALQDEVKDLNAELEYTLDLLDELEDHESNIKPGDPRLRKLGKRFLHDDPAADE